MQRDELNDFNTSAVEQARDALRANLEDHASFNEMLQHDTLAQASAATKKYQFDFFSDQANASQPEQRGFKWERVAQTSANLVGYQHETVEAPREPKPRMTLQKMGKNIRFSLESVNSPNRCTLFGSTYTASTALDSSYACSGQGSAVYLTGGKSHLFDMSLKNINSIQEQRKGASSFIDLQRRSSVDSLNDRNEDSAENGAQEEVRCSHVEGQINKPATDTYNRLHSARELELQPVPASSYESAGSSGNKSSGRRRELHCRSSI